MVFKSRREKGWSKKTFESLFVDEVKHGDEKNTSETEISSRAHVVVFLFRLDYGLA